MGRSGCGIAQDNVRVLDMSDQFFVSNDIANTPSGSIESFSDGPNANCMACKLGIQSCNAREGRRVVKMLVDFVGKYYDPMFDAQIANSGELFDREYFS